MALSLEILDLGDVHLDAAFEVRGRTPGKPYSCRTSGYLIHGLADGLVLVDTGYRAPEMMETGGMRGVIRPGCGLETELAKRGLQPKDIRYILHTHLHIDHAGKDDIFPMSTTVIMNRDELAMAAGGLAGLAYPPEDVKHLVDRVYTKDAAWILDVQDAHSPIELFPHVAVQLAGGHTRGSINVLVETDKGTAVICGDVLYDIHDQYVNPLFEIGHREVRIATNTQGAERTEKAAIKKVLESGAWICPMHELPTLLDDLKQPQGRLDGIVVPGPVAPFVRLKSAA